MVHLQRRTVGDGGDVCRLARPYLRRPGAGAECAFQIGRPGGAYYIRRRESGAALVVKADSPIKTPADFRGKKIATPQLGNTQDISCRAWLKAQGFKVTQTGGDVLVLPTANPDQLALFQKGDVDAVWTVEPWVTRLERDGNGKIFLEDNNVLTTWLASSAKFLKDHRDIARKIANANVELRSGSRHIPMKRRKN